VLEFCNSNEILSQEAIKTRLRLAEAAYAKFLDALGFNWQADPNMKDTPKRVAKMWLNEIAQGCYTTPPVITAFDNMNHYDGMVFQGNITVNSFCAHHHVSFFGHAYVAYIPTPDSKVIGLSKINRIVEWFARRPQIQEELTMQIHQYIDKVCEGNLGVAVHISAQHLCVKLRGVEHPSVMKTTKLSGAFLDKEDHAKLEFYENVKNAISEKGI